MNTKMLPVGIEDFKEIRDKDYYYVDKTEFISDLVAGGSKVHLFTRPCRFGKTLNMSMLRYFFEIGTDKSIFDGLKITENKAVCDAHMGKYPVVSVSLKGVCGMSFEEAFGMLCTVIRKEAGRLDYLCESPKLTDKEKASIGVLTDKTIALDDVKDSLSRLTAALEKHYGRKAVLLIDEYDVPLDKAYTCDYYPQMVSTIRAMFDAALKTNNSIDFAVLTGCLRVSKESIFTGFNNPKVHSISDERFDEYFGFTDDEVKRMLSDYGLEDHYEETREWYDGYRFGGQYVYCPWDVINYCDDLMGYSRAKPKMYWINTSGNDMVRNLINVAADGSAQMEVERLIDGETITKTLNEQLTHSEINKNIDNLWSILYMTGYLTVADEPEGDSYRLRIPNREVREIYKQQVLEWFKDKTRAGSEKLEGLYAAFEGGDTQSITEILSNQLYETVSFYDAYESFYHGFLLALLSTCSQWTVTSNRETGKGRSDIMVCRKDRKMGFVVEVKNVREEKDIEAACAEAMKQIEEMDYTAVLRRYGVKEIIEYGIAFWDKRCVVRAKKV